MPTKLKIYNKFYGGQVRDERSLEVGVASNIEEVDIFSNQNYIQAEQILTADAMPASTEIYSYTVGDDDTVYGYGKSTSSGEVRIVSVANGGADNPGAFSTLFTSAETTNEATVVSDFKFFRSAEASNPTSLYYIYGASTTWYIGRYNIGAAAEQTWNGSAWAAGDSHASSQLTGLTGSFMRPTMKVIYGELYVCNGQYIAKVDSDGALEEKAFTLPKEWEAVDIIPVSDVAIILCRNKNKSANETKGFWWDLTRTTQFDDSFTVPCGGPQWIINHREQIRIMCAINGKARFYQLSGAFPGAIPLELPNIEMSNVSAETSTQPISSAKMVAVKDKILYFAVKKTDKTGIYGLGQIDADKPVALVLSKRFHTSDYSLHSPYGLLIQGPNYYAAFLDNATASNARCESNNSPTRSSNAVYETVYVDDKAPFTEKTLEKVYVVAQPLAASTAIVVSARADHASAYTAVNEPDGTAMDTTSQELGVHKVSQKGFAFQVKIAFTSSTTSTPKVVAYGLQLNAPEFPQK